MDVPGLLAPACLKLVNRSTNYALLWSPGAFRRFIPTRETLVLDLDACLFLPRDYDEIISVSVSDKPPNVSFPESLSQQAMASILSRCALISVPSSKALARFDDDCSQLVPSYQSIFVSSCPGQLLPLWVAAFLLDLSSIYDLHCRWIQSLKWVRGILARASPSLSPLCDAIQEGLKTLRIAAKIPALMLPTHSGEVNVASDDLLCLLGDWWLSNWNIDPLINLINRFAESDSIGCRALSLCEATGLHDLPEDGSRVTFPSLAHLEHNIQSGNVTCILAPTFINNNHFTLFSLNFTDHTYAYADSLSSLAIPPEKHLNALTRWAHHVSGRLFMPEKPTSFNLPYQNDTFSCGAVVLSAISAIILGTPQWSKQCANSFRLLWFAWSINPGYSKVFHDSLLP